MKVASVSQIRDLEAAADRSLLSYEAMMLRAGAAASASLQRRRSITSSTLVVFLIGKGNNGGDGLVMACDLARSTGADIRLYLLHPRASSDKPYQAARRAQLAITFAVDDHESQQLADLIQRADILIDAVLGIGARLPLSGEAATALERANACLRQRAARPFILAIDCPSGIDCDTGEADEFVIAADATITFIAAKRGHFTFPAARYVGALEMASIGITDSLPELEQIRSMAVDGRAASALLPARPLDGHKGVFGKVMVVAGSQHYIGAIALAAEAAYRSGAGLVTVATTRRLIETVAGCLREPTWLPLPEIDGAIAESAADLLLDEADGYDALLVGCGLGKHKSTHAFLRRLLKSDRLPATVLDADALNLLSQDRAWWARLPADTIITPHPGELARMMRLSPKAINADRWAIARQCAEDWDLVTLLKGAHTLVAAPDGRIAVLPFKTDALSTAGAGDVLAGLIAGLRAQGLNAFESACLGAFVHGSAGTIAAEAVGSSRSVIAGDILPALGNAFAVLELP